MHSRSARPRLLVGLVFSLVLGLLTLLVLGVMLEGESGALFGALFEDDDSESFSVSSDDRDGEDGKRGGAGRTGSRSSDSDANSDANSDAAKGVDEDGRPNIAYVVGDDDASALDLSGLPPIQPIGVGFGLGAGGGASVDLSGAADGKTGSEGGAGTYRARVLDAITGRGVAGVEIQLTSYRGDVHLADAGVPMISAQLVTTNSEGSFEFACPDPEDPQLRLHVQTAHADFESVVFVLHRRDGIRGFWREVETTADAPDSVWLLGRHLQDAGVAEIEIHVRRAETVPVRVIDRSGQGLGYVPVRVVPRRDSHTFLEEDEPPKIARNGRYVRLGEPRVLYTDPDGYLWIPFGEYRYSFEILHPDYYLYDKDPVSGEEVFATLVRELPYTEEVLLEARSEWRERHQLVDADRVPIPGVEVEIALVGMVPLRIITDEEGHFQVGVQPYPFSAEKPLSISNPRSGRLTVLSPEFRNRSVDIVLPLSGREILLPGRPKRRLTFRTVVGEKDEAKSIPPSGLRTTFSGMTLVHLGADGRVDLVGDPPASGEFFGVVVSGYLPTTVEMPDTGPREGDVDLGDLAFEEGWTKEIHVTGADATALRSSRVFVTCVDEKLQDFPDLEEHRYEPGPDGVVRVRGLRRGSYLVGVEGGAINALSRSLEVFKEDLDKPFELPVDLSPEETVVVNGFVSGLTPRQADEMQVIERFRIRGIALPITMPSYPLSTDGRFGSLRRMASVEAVHVSVISGTEKAADGVLARREGPMFPMGELRVRRFPHAELSFTNPLVGEVLAPLWVQLEGEDGKPTFARMRLRGVKLFIDNLRHGRYVLRWKTLTLPPATFSRDESFLIDVKNKFGGAVVGTIPRRLGFEEIITVKITDVDGLAVPGVGVQQIGARLPPLDPSRRNDLTLGAVSVSSGRPTDFKIVADSFLRTRVVIPAGERVPRDFTMYRAGNSLRAHVLDTDGELFDGVLEISWKPLTPSPIEIGEPVLARVTNGRLKASDLPPLPLRFTFRVKDSSDATTRMLTIVDDGDPDDIGTIRLGETRVIRGVVLLFDGSPAKDAIVAVVPRDKAHRYPMREPIDFARYAHKTTTNVQGDFELDGLPRELPSDWALIAHLDGQVDVVEDPVDTDLFSHQLFLGEPDLLTLQIGYDNDAQRDRYRFDLEYQEDPIDPDTRFSLGEIPADFYGLREFTNIRPGVYRVTWRLRDEYASLPPVWEDVNVPLGGSASLRFVVEGTVLRGVARLNGSRVEKGWILLTHDPGLNGGTRVGRIIDGKFELIDAPDTLKAYAAVIPETTPQPHQNIPLGEALPRDIPGYRASMRSGRLDFDYVAYGVEFRFSETFLARYPGIRLTYQHHEWNGRTFETRPETMAIESTEVAFRMMRKGRYRFTVRNERGSMLRNLPVAIRDEDVTRIIR
jgi:hypothetical protein